MQRLVDPSNRIEDLLQLTLHVRTVGVELHVQVAVREDSVRALHFLPHGNTGPDWDHLDFRQSFHGIVPV